MAELSKNYQSISLLQQPCVDIASINIADNFNGTLQLEINLQLFDYYLGSDDSRPYSWWQNADLENGFEFKFQLFNTESVYSQAFNNTISLEPLYEIKSNFATDPSLPANLAFGSENLTVVFHRRTYIVEIPKTDSLCYLIEFSDKREILNKLSSYKKTGKIFNNRQLNSVKEAIPTVVDQQTQEEQEVVIGDIFTVSQNNENGIYSFKEVEFISNSWPNDLLIKKNATVNSAPQNTVTLAPLFNNTVYVQQVSFDEILVDNESRQQLVATREKQKFLSSQKDNFFGAFFDFIDEKNNLNIIFDFDFDKFVKQTDNSFQGLNTDYLIYLASKVSPAIRGIYSAENPATTVQITKIDSFNDVKRVLNTTINKNVNSYADDRYLGRPYLANYKIALKNQQKNMLHFVDFWSTEDKNCYNYLFKISYKDEKRNILKNMIAAAQEHLTAVERFLEEARNLYYTNIFDANQIRDFVKQNALNNIYSDVYMTCNKAEVDSLLLKYDIEQTKSIIQQSFVNIFKNEITLNMISTLELFIQNYRKLINFCNEKLINKYSVIESQVFYQTFKKPNKEDPKLSYFNLNAAAPLNVDPGYQLSIEKPEFKTVFASSNDRYLLPQSIKFEDNYEEIFQLFSAIEGVLVVSSGTASNNLKNKLFSKISKKYFNNTNQNFNENAFFIEMIEKYLVSLLGPNFNTYKFSASIENLIDDFLIPEIKEKRKKVNFKTINIVLIDELKRIFDNLVGNSKDYVEISDKRAFLNSLSIVFPSYSFLFDAMKTNLKTNLFSIYGFLYWILQFGNLCRLEILTDITASGKPEWKLINPSLVSPNNLYLCRLVRVTCDELGFPYEQTLAFSPESEYILLQG